MKKVKWLFLGVAYDWLFSLLALGYSLNTNYDGILTPDNLDTKLTIRDTLSMFWSLFTFNVEGFPPLITIIFVYMPNIFMFLVIVTLIFDRGD